MDGINFNSLDEVSWLPLEGRFTEEEIKVVDELLNKKRDGVLCKLDIEKTYDHVN